jgi:hypothetical protein
MQADIYTILHIFRIFLGLAILLKLFEILNSDVQSGTKLKLFNNEWKMTFL